MATKQQLVSKAKKANVKIEVDFGDEYVVVMIDIEQGVLDESEVDA